MSSSRLRALRHLAVALYNLENTHISIVAQCQYARLIRSPLCESQSIDLLNHLATGVNKSSGRSTYHVIRVRHASDADMVILQKS
jgi:hypothetical protein